MITYVIYFFAVIGVIATLIGAYGVAGYLIQQWRNDDNLDDPQEWFDPQSGWEK